MERKKTLQEITYVLVLLVAIIVLFFWYTSQNSKRMEERNKNYAADSARLKAEQIDEELSNGLDIINAYSYFIEKSLTEPEVTASMLKEMEEKSGFDTLLFTAADGTDYVSDGRVADVTECEFIMEVHKEYSNIYFI